MPDRPANAAAPARDREHPFLICSRDQFPALRRRADNEPWATMKRRALEAAAEGFAFLGKMPADAHRLQQYLGALALAYIVEPDRRAAHARAVHQAVVEHLAAIDFDQSKLHIGVVSPGGAAFSAIIALDIVQADLSTDQIAACEKLIDEQLGRIRLKGPWPLARMGVKGTWAVYKGERTEPDDAYLREMLSQMTEDGVATSAMSYGVVRFGSGVSRPQKSGYADVLEFTGIDRRYYQHPRLRRFYTWLYGCAVTPDRHLHWFGDMASDRPSRGALLWRTGRFGDQAGRYAAWALADRQPPGHVLSYVLMTEAHEPELPRSRYYMDGGAFFREARDTPDALAAAMYNITSQPGWHAHEETNAISLVAHGTQLLVNGGWLGNTTRPAELQNTLSLNGKRHEARTGSGLDEALTSDRFDYAAGRSGDAMPGAAHFVRSLLLVHGQDQVPGYFVTLDHVHAPVGDTVNHYLQLSTRTEPSEVEAGVEYEAVVDLFTQTPGVRFSMFYGQAPQSISRRLVPSGSARRKVPEHYRLAAEFPTDERGKARLITLVYPHGQKRARVAFNRMADDGADGVSLAQVGDVVDYVYTSAGDQAHKLAGGAVFRGRAACYRLQGERLRFFFVRRGVAFRAGDVGFTADKPVSLHLRGGTGRAWADEATKMRLYHPGIRGVRRAGRELEPTASGDGWIAFTLPAGENQPLELELR